MRHGILVGRSRRRRVHANQALVVDAGDPVPRLEAELVGPPVVAGGADGAVVAARLAEPERLPLLGRRTLLVGLGVRGNGGRRARGGDGLRPPVLLLGPQPRPQRLAVGLGLLGGQEHLDGVARLVFLLGDRGGGGQRLLLEAALLGRPLLGLEALVVAEVGDLRHGRNQGD